MHPSSIPLCGLLLILNLQLFSTYPISTGLTDTDMDMLKTRGDSGRLQEYCRNTRRMQHCKLTIASEDESSTMILHRLEESVSEQTEVDQRVPAEKDSMDSLNIEEAADGQQPHTGLDEAAIKEFLSAKNLKNVRNDSSRRSSGCFGRRMDRIGSMSSLGCNTVGRYNPK